MIDTNPIFLYLKKQNISINKKEFFFQIQTHPDYPSLLAIIDTLNFFDISSKAFKITLEEYDYLPNYFVTFLDLGEGMELFLIEKNHDKYFYFNGKNKSTINKDELIWNRRRSCSKYISFTRF